jgi:hypothetical protein
VFIVHQNKGLHGVVQASEHLELLAGKDSYDIAYFASAIVVRGSTKQKRLPEVGSRK